MKKIILIFILSIAIYKVFAQDYIIDFEGTGASNSVDEVIVENLDQNTKLLLQGYNILHLSNKVGKNEISINYGQDLKIYPNPTSGNCTVEFQVEASGKTNIEVFNLNGILIGKEQYILNKGKHSFDICGLPPGLYILRIFFKDYSLIGKVLSSGSLGSGIGINFKHCNGDNLANSTLKSTDYDVYMQYNSGERLKFTGSSDNFQTILTEIPTQSKTITFPFYECMDTDGSNYPVVHIGSQLWMAENLKTQRYQNGDPIEVIYDSTEWKEAKFGALSYFENNSGNDNFYNIYNILYNWYSVSDERNIAPKGWRVSTREDWITLSNFLGGEQEAGKKIKDFGTNYWEYSSSEVTNESGFTGLPCGYRYADGNFYSLGQEALWWCNTEYDSDLSDLFGLSIYNDSLINYIVEKSSGLSVRCIKEGFNTSSVVPTLGPPVIDNVTFSSAEVRSNIISDGGATINDRGICWSKSSNPNIDKYKMTNGTGPGSYSNQISGLTEGTTYYVRSFATNSVGTGYGNVISFKTKGTANENNCFTFYSDTNGEQETCLLAKYKIEDKIFNFFGFYYGYDNSWFKINGLSILNSTLNKKTVLSTSEDGQSFYYFDINNNVKDSILIVINDINKRPYFTIYNYNWKTQTGIKILEQFLNDDILKSAYIPDEKKYPIIKTPNGVLNYENKISESTPEDEEWFYKHVKEFGELHPVVEYGNKITLKLDSIRKVATKNIADFCVKAKSLFEGVSENFKFFNFNHNEFQNDVVATYEQSQTQNSIEIQDVKNGVTIPSKEEDEFMDVNVDGKDYHITWESNKGNVHLFHPEAVGSIGISAYGFGIDDIQIGYNYNSDVPTYNSDWVLINVAEGEYEIENECDYNQSKKKYFTAKIVVNDVEYWSPIRFSSLFGTESSCDCLKGNLTIKRDGLYLVGSFNFVAAEPYSCHYNSNSNTSNCDSKINVKGNFRTWIYR